MGCPMSGDGGLIYFFHMLEGFRGEDCEYECLEGGEEWRNRFAYVSNGFSTREAGRTLRGN